MEIDSVNGMVPTRRAWTTRLKGSCSTVLIMMRYTLFTLAKQQ